MLIVRTIASSSQHLLFFIKQPNLFYHTRFTYVSTSNSTKPIFDASYQCIPDRLKKNMKTDSKCQLNSFGCGEDSCLVTDKCLGVADGVGGQSLHSKSSNSSLYSRLLMHYVGQRFEEVFIQNNCDQDKEAEYMPRNLMDQAHNQTNTHNILGSSTACIAVLNQGKGTENFCENGDLADKTLLCVANLGDSGFRLIRDEKIILRSTEQVTGFNAPLQLGPKNLTHLASMSDIYEIEVLNNDILILMTDGVLDNLFDDEICKLINDNHSHKTSEELAKLISLYANKMAYSKRESPFEIQAKKYGRYNKHLAGGKPDDICVVVGKIKI